LAIEEYGNLLESLSLPLQALDSVEALEGFVVVEPVTGGGAVGLMDQAHEAVVVDRLTGQPAVTNQITHLPKSFRLRH
tara:strand:- start:1469 stop:1702 length:234 start_codon:yes stop_codon:yes gene_type:complete